MLTLFEREAFFNTLEFRVSASDEMLAEAVALRAKYLAFEPAKDVVELAEAMMLDIEQSRHGSTECRFMIYRLIGIIHREAHGWPKNLAFTADGRFAGAATEGHC